MNAAAAMGAIQHAPSPPLVGRHPDLRALMALAEQQLAWLERFSTVLQSDVPMEFGDNGLQVPDADGWRIVLDMMRARRPQFELPSVRFERDLARHFPQMAGRIRKARLEMLEWYTDTMAFLGHALGTDDAEQLGVDMSIPMPDPAPRGPSVAYEP